MGLEEYKEKQEIKKNEKKTSTPSGGTGPSEGGIEDFLDESDDGSMEIEGGFTLDDIQEEEKDTEVVKVFGGPGTGKTTTIVGNTDIEDYQGILERLMQEGNPRDVMLIAYTRAAADEAKGRLHELTDLNKSTIDDRLATIHSLAMKFNNLRPQDIVEIRWYNDKYDFCNEVGMEYDMNADQDEDEALSVPDDEGHMFFKMLGWLKSKLKPPSDWQDSPISHEWNRSGEEFVELAKKWEKYKAKEGIWEFDDAILESVNNGDTINTKELFIDEVQDLYPLQQAFVDNQFGHVDRIWLAGDDDQTIYEWAGAKPEYFLEMEGKMKEKRPKLWEDKAGHWASEGVYILDQSWRMPSEILELAKMTIEQVGERQDKQIKPHHDGGEFIPLRNPATDRVIELINPEDTMILFRAKYHMSNFGKKLLKAGIPFTDRFKTWRDDVVALRNGIACLKNEEDYMSGYAAERIIKEMPSKALENGVSRDRQAERFAAKDKVPTDTVLQKVRYSEPTDYSGIARWCQEFEEANYYQAMGVRENLKNHKEMLTPNGIELETIHGSKGQEADTIILSTDTTQSVLENMSEHDISDPERRLYYVGMTRTKNRLVMCEGIDSDSPTIPIDSIIGSGWRDKYDWENDVREEKINTDF